MKQKGLRCMLSSDCTKASNPFWGLHFLINPRNWQDMNNLTYTSRCIDAGGYLRLFSGIFLLQDDPTTYHGRIKDWRLGGLANCACAILRPSKQFIWSSFLGTLNQMDLRNILSWEICDTFPQYFFKCILFLFGEFSNMSKLSCPKRCEISLVTFVRLFFTLSFQMCRQIECPQVENGALEPLLCTRR